MKKRLSRGIAMLLVLGMTAASMSDLPAGLAQAKAAEKEQEARQESELKKQLAATESEFPKGAIGFMASQISVAEGGSTKIEVVRQGGTDTKATVKFKAIDVSADYGKDYQLSVTEGKDTTVLAAAENQESLLSRYSDSMTVDGKEETEGGQASGEEDAGTAAEQEADAAKAAETALAESGKVSLSGLSGSEKAKALQSGKVSKQKSWREVERSDQKASEYAQAEEITKKGGDALEDVLKAMGGVTYTLTFKKGEYKKAIDLETLDDDMAESDEQIMLMLTDAKGSELSASHTGYVNIKDNESSEVNVFQMQDPQINVKRGEEQVTLTVCRTSGTEQMAVMGVGTIADTAKAGKDYEAVTETLVFPPGAKEKTITVPLVVDSDTEGDVSFYVGATTNNDSVIDASSKATRVVIEAPAAKKAKASRTFSENISAMDKTENYGGSGDIWARNWSSAEWSKGGLDLRNAKSLQVTYSSTQGSRSWKDGCNTRSSSDRSVTLYLDNKQVDRKQGASFTNTTVSIDLKKYQNKNMVLKAVVKGENNNDNAMLKVNSIQVIYQDYTVEVANSALNDDNAVFNKANCYKEKMYTAKGKYTETGNYYALGSLKVNGSSNTMIYQCGNTLGISYSLNSNAKNSAGIAPSESSVELKDIELYNNSKSKWESIGSTSVSAEKLLTTYRDYATNDHKFRLRPVFKIRQAQIRFVTDTKLGEFNGFNNGDVFKNMTLLDTIQVSAAPKVGHAVKAITVSGSRKIVDNARKDTVKFAPQQTGQITVTAAYEDASIDVAVHPRGGNKDKGSVLYYDSENPENSVVGKNGETMTIHNIKLNSQYNIIGLASPGYRAVWSDGTADDDKNGILSQEELNRHKDHQGFSSVNGEVLQYIPREPYSRIYYDFQVPAVADKANQTSIVGKVSLADTEIFTGREIVTKINGATVSVGESASDVKEGQEDDRYSVLTKRLDKRNTYANAGDGYFEIPGNGSFYVNDYHLVNVQYRASNGSTLIGSEVMQPGTYKNIELQTDSVMTVEDARVMYKDEASDSWNDLDYRNVDNGDYTCRMEFDVVSQKTAIQPRKAVLVFYSDGAEKAKVEDTVDAEHAGQFSFEFNPSELALPSGTTAGLRIYDQNDEMYYERQTGLTVRESIGIIDLVNSFDFGGLNTAIKLVGKIDSQFDLGWNGSLNARDQNEHVTYGEDQSITLSIGFEKPDLVSTEKTNKKTLQSLAADKADADQALIDEKKKSKPDADKVKELEEKAKKADEEYKNKVKDSSSPAGEKRSAEVAGNASLSLAVRLSLTFAYDEKNAANYFERMVLAVEIDGGAGAKVKFATPIGITISLGFEIKGNAIASFIIARKTDQEVNPKYYLTSVKNENSITDNAGKINLFKTGNGVEKPFKMSGEFELNPSLTLTAGVGIGGIVDVEVSGTAAFKMNFYTDDQENNGMVNLSAKIGVKVLFIQASWPFVSKDVNLFGNTSAAGSSLDNENYLHDSASLLQASDRKYLENRGRWNGGGMSAKSLDENEKGVKEAAIQTGIYSGTDIKLMKVNDEGDYLGVFLDDPGKGTDALNGAQVYYSIYSHVTGEWSSPVLLENDQTTDQDVSAFDLGDRGIIVTWSSANKKFTDADSRTDMMNAMDIHAAFFNKNTKVFGDKMSITKTTAEDSEADVTPSVIYNNDSLLIYYTKNKYEVSDAAAEGEVVGDVVHPAYSYMAYREYHFTNSTPSAGDTAGSWIEDYGSLKDTTVKEGMEAGYNKAKEDGASDFEKYNSFDEYYSEYVTDWYGQVMFDTVPPVYVEEELDEEGYWKDNKEPTIYNSAKVTDTSKVNGEAEGDQTGIVEGGVTVGGSETIEAEWSPKIIDSDAISYNDLGIFAFTGDYDQSMETTGDRDIFIQTYDFKTGAMTHPIVITSNSKEDCDVHFIKAENDKSTDTYLTWLSDGDIVALNISNVVKNCLVKKEKDGQEYYIIDKTKKETDGYEPVLTMVKGEVAKEDDGTEKEGAVSEITGFDVKSNQDYIYVTWTQTGQTLKEGVEEDSDEATVPENQNIETQIYLARYDFAEDRMTDAVQVTSGSGDNYSNLSFVVNSDSTLTALAAKAGTKVVDAAEFNETVEDYNENIGDPDKKQDEVTEEDFTKYAAVDSDNKTLVAMTVTPCSVLKVKEWLADDFIAGAENSVTIELLNDGIDTVKDASVAVTDASGESLLQGEDGKAADSVKIDIMMGGSTYNIPCTLSLPDNADKGEIQIKVTDKDGKVILTDTYESKVKEEKTVTRVEAAETDERDVYDISFDVENGAWKNAPEMTAAVGVVTADGDEKLADVTIPAMEKGEKKTFTATVTVDSAKQFTEGEDEEGQMTETGTFYVDNGESRNTASVVRTASDAQLKQTDSIQSAQFVGGREIKIGVGETLHQELDIVSSLADEKTGATGTEGLQVRWETEDESVASVSSDGILAGMKKGTTKLTAYVYPKDETTKISVTEDDSSQYNFGTHSNDFVITPNKALKSYQATVTVVGNDTAPDNTGNTSATPDKKDEEKKDTPTETANKTTTKKTVTKSGVTYKISGKSATVTKTKKSIKKLTIPNKVKIGGKNYPVTKINRGVFKNCKKLKTVVIGKNVKTIGKNAFKGCKKLKSIKFKGTKVTKIGKGAFSGIYKKAVVNVPKKSKKKYKKKLTKKTGITSKMKIK